MTDLFLKLLRCPSCGEILEHAIKIEEIDQELEWGTIVCKGCDSKYPVAFGIPIMKPLNNYIDEIENVHMNIFNQSHKGILVGEIVRKIESGEIENVKQDLLFYHRNRVSIQMIFKQKKEQNLDNKLTRILPNSIVKTIGKRNLYLLYWLITKVSFQNLRLKKWEEKKYERLINASTAQEFIYNYFHELKSEKAMYNYFTYRFGQPRYLVALSLFTTFPKDKKPILDIACGTGHLLHHLTYRDTQQPVIGVDRNFAKLYLAKKFIAPKGNYFCAEADQALPFENDSFSGVYCSDAFQYFTYRTLSIREMKRIISPDGIIFITQVSSIQKQGYKGNVIISPKQLKNYFQEMPNVVFNQDVAVERYIKKYGLDLSEEHSMNDLNNAEWTTIVASNRKDYFYDYNQFKDWPHVLGRLNLNPLYHKSGKDEFGNIILKFKFPSEWYEYDAPDWRKYAPDTVVVSQSTMESISKGIRTPEVDILISKWVVFGMPENYL